MIALLAALALSGSVTAADVSTGSPDGPWRQIIRFEPTEANPDGTSVWVTEDSLLAPDAGRSSDVRPARELWVVHGAVTGGQAYVIKSNRYDCDAGDIHTDRVEAFTREGGLLGVAGPNPEPGYGMPHSAEAEVSWAVCRDSERARRGATAPAVAQAIALAGPDTTAPPTASLSFDVDYDGQDDHIRIAMRPHSMRHDVEFALSSRPARSLNVVVAEQPPSGPLVERLIRPLERDRYLIACRMDQGHDVSPCVPEYVLAQRGVEVVTPGHPTIIVWLTMGERSVARLP
jgi:hypothetical protein